MRSTTLGKVFGGCVGIVTVLHAVSALSLPVLSRRPTVGTTLVATALLLAHAALYWLGPRIRNRRSLSVYAGTQAAAVFSIALSAVPKGLTIGLLMLVIIELTLLAEARWVPAIAGGAIALFVAAELLTSGLYQAATAGGILALTGGLAYGIAVLVRGAGEPAFAPQASAPPAPFIVAPELSAREREVLTALAGGARNSEIAAALGITERTVKAHLTSIYQKLGVESRSGAIAAVTRYRTTANSE